MIRNAAHGAAAAQSLAARGGLSFSVDRDKIMALIDRLFGHKKTLSELDRTELRKEEILLTKQRDRLFKQIETDRHRQAKDLPTGRDAKKPRTTQSVWPRISSLKRRNN